MINKLQLIINRYNELANLMSKPESMNNMKKFTQMAREHSSMDTLVEHAKKFDAQVIIRGLRAVADFEYEFQMAGMNAKLEPNIETIFLMASESLQLTSARFVKEVAYHDGEIKNFVPKNVLKMFKKKKELI